MKSWCYKRCEICKKRRLTDSNIFLARFPQDPNICRQWVKAAGVEDLAYVPIERLHTSKYLCGAHFTESSFNKNKVRLKRCAVPTLELLNSPLPDELLKDFPLYIHSSHLIEKSKSARLSQIVAEGGTSQVVNELPKGILDQQYTTSNLCFPQNLPVDVFNMIHDHSYVYKSFIMSFNLPTLHNDNNNNDVDDTGDDDHDGGDNVPEGTVTDINYGGITEIEDSTEIFSWQKPVVEVDIHQDNNDVDLVTLNLDVYVNQNICATNESDTKGLSVEDEIEECYEGYKCSVCEGVIEGTRYTCVQCIGVELCTACEQNGQHAEHYVLRVPGNRPLAEVTAVLKRIRDIMAQCMADREIKFEPDIKEEAFDPLQCDTLDFVSGTENLENDEPSTALSNIERSHNYPQRDKDLVPLISRNGEETTAAEDVEIPEYELNIDSGTDSDENTYYLHTTRTHRKVHLDTFHMDTKANRCKRVNVQSRRSLYRSVPDTKNPRDDDHVLPNIRQYYGHPQRYKYQVLSIGRYNKKTTTAEETEIPEYELNIDNGTNLEENRYYLPTTKTLRKKHIHNFHISHLDNRSKKIQETNAAKETGIFNDFTVYSGEKFKRSVDQPHIDNVKRMNKTHISQCGRIIISNDVILKDRINSNVRMKLLPVRLEEVLRLQRRLDVN